MTSMMPLLMMIMMVDDDDVTYEGMRASHASHARQIGLDDDEDESETVKSCAYWLLLYPVIGKR